MPCRCFFGHQQLEGGSGSYVALQRCAQAIGLAHLDAASHLCLHPKYGPWFSLRAVLVFDGVKFNGECLPKAHSLLIGHSTLWLSFQLVHCVVTFDGVKNRGELLHKMGLLNYHGVNAA